MPKTKYRFDPVKLSYDKIVLTTWQKLFVALKYIVGLSVVSILFLMLLSLFFDTPGEKMQKRENEKLLLQYEVLTKKLISMEKSMQEIQQHDDNIYRLIFGTDPIPASKRQAGVGGVNPYKNLEGFSNSELVIETTRKIDKLTRQIVVQSESYKEVLKLAHEKEQFLSSIPAISPIADKDLTRFASGYGYRIHPIYRTLKMHTGIDLTAPVGTPVFVTGDGVVVNAGYTPGGYGNKVIVDHGFGFKTLYGHLNNITVRVGQRIKRGEKIGTVGNTGRSTAPHLHYEVRKNNKTENPVNYYYNDITPEEYDQMVDVSSRMTMSFD